MLEEVKEIISTYSSTSNLAITEEFRLKIIANLSEVLDNEALFKVKGFTRVEDFYNYDISYTENINHFIETTRSEEDLGAFALYTLIEKIKTLNEILFEDIFDFDGQIAYLKELDLILEIEKGFDYISEFIKEFDKTQKKTLPFLVNNKYQIFFSGYSYEDVKSLSPDNVINLISKLSNPLATEDAVPTSVGIGHVNSHYGTAYLRMHLGLHYRIAFERYHGMTIILGIAQKTGKFGEYNRYDALARKNDAIHKEADAFKEGTESDDHSKTIELLKIYYLKYLEQENIKINKETGTTLK